MFKLKRKVLAKNLFSLIILIVVPILCLNLFVLVYLNNDMKRMEMEKDVKFLSLAGQTLDTILNDINQLISLLEFDDNFTNAIDGFIGESGELSASRYIYLNSVMENTFRTFLAKPYIRSAYFYHEKNDKFVFTTDGIINLTELADLSWLTSYRKNSEEKNYWVEVREARYPNMAGPVETMTLYRKIPIFAVQPGSGVGVIVMNLETQYFDRLFSNLPDAQDKLVYILDDQNNVLYHNGSSELLNLLTADDLSQLEAEGHMVKETKQDSYLASYVQASYYDWKYVSLFPTEKLNARLSWLKDISLYITLASLVIGILLAYRYTRKSYAPVETLVRLIKHYNEGRDITQHGFSKDDEYGFITLHVIRNFIEKNEIQKSLTESKLLQRETELYALQAQINPHFLYNMLEAINWEAIDRLGKDNAVSFLLITLSNNLRYVTDRSRYIVTIEEELQYLQKYVIMQQVMKDDAFIFELDADPAAIHGQTLKLSIQPLVENAILHGLAQRVGGGQIRVNVRIRNNSVHIRISDNGSGMSTERLQELHNELSSSEPLQFEGLGMCNIHQRLRLRYGEQYGLSVRSKRGWGTVVSMHLPFDPYVKNLPIGT